MLFKLGAKIYNADKPSLQLPHYILLHSTQKMLIVCKSSSCKSKYREKRSKYHFCLPSAVSTNASQNLGGMTIQAPPQWLNNNLPYQPGQRTRSLQL